MKRLGEIFSVVFCTAMVFVLASGGQAAFAAPAKGGIYLSKSGCIRK